MLKLLNYNTWLISCSLILTMMACGDIAPLAGGGGSSDGPIALMGINTIGLVIEAPTRGDGYFLAQLGIATGDGTQAKWVAGVSEPAVEIGDERWPLMTTTNFGIFETDSFRAPGFHVSPGDRVRFSFKLTNAIGESEEFEAYVDAPMGRAEPTLEPSLAYLSREELPLHWPALDAAALLVHRLGEIPETTFNTFSLIEPSDIPIALQEATRLGGERGIILPPEALPTPAVYLAELLTFTFMTPATPGWLSANHGAQSWYGVALSQSVEFEAL